MAKNNSLLIIGVLGIGAYLYFKNQSSDITSGGGVGFHTPTSPLTGYEVTPTADIPDSPIGQVPIADKETAISMAKSTSKGESVYFPDYGVLSQNGQGYSTQYPKEMSISNSKASTVKIGNTTFSSSAGATIQKALDLRKMKSLGFVAK